MNEEELLYCLGILTSGALNYYQAIETVKCADRQVRDYIIYSKKFKDD